MRNACKVVSPKRDVRFLGRGIDIDSFDRLNGECLCVPVPHVHPVGHTVTGLGAKPNHLTYNSNMGERR
jgi:hypothetical protein